MWVSSTMWTGKPVAAEKSCQAAPFSGIIADAINGGDPGFPEIIREQEGGA